MMAKKNSTVIRVDADTAKEFKELSIRLDKSISKIAKDMLKALKGKKIKSEITF
jgi:hypothetical protein